MLLSRKTELIKNGVLLGFMGHLLLKIELALGIYFEDWGKPKIFHGLFVGISMKSCTCLKKKGEVPREEKNRGVSYGF